MVDLKFEQCCKEILQKELIPALGCTEPIAIALAAAKARDVLGEAWHEILQVDVYCSGNIIKNVKGVVVPNSGGLRGIPVATAIGLVAGDQELGLEVLDAVTEADLADAMSLLQKQIIQVHLVENEENLYLRTELHTLGNHASVEIQYDHTRINKIIRNGEVLLDNAITSVDDHVVDRSQLSVEKILDYARSVTIDEELRALLDRQIQYNFAVSEEGLARPYGAQVGRTILESNLNCDTYDRAKAYTAAGSDARMGGSSLPVVINSGSGNQGLTVSVPLIIFAKEQNWPRDLLLRGLLVSNLLAVHQKQFIGKLSAFCGVVSASAAAAAGLAYVKGLTYEEISMQIVNTIATTGGMICDGAKSSCAGKIAAALHDAFIALEMARRHRVYRTGEGIVGKDVEETIRNVGFVARSGMRETDIEILKLMVK